MSSQYHFENYCLFLFCHSYKIACPQLKTGIRLICLVQHPENLTDYSVFLIIIIKDARYT